jgi:beta-glucosidase
VNAYQGLKTAIQAIDKDATVDFMADATAALSGYDVVVVCAGTDRDTASEDNDRLTLALPNGQGDLISKAVAANPRTVVYLETVGAVDVRPFADKAPALLWSSYNGQRQGEALADVVTGKVNPGGRLPLTWYADQDQLPDTTDYAIRPGDGKHGRTYMYFDGAVTFPFGYGLSYTSFQISNGATDVASASAGGTVHVTADVKNTGAMAGSTVVQLYVATPDSPAALQRPVKRLAGFAKVSLQPGQTKSVDIAVAIPDLAFWDDATARYVVDNGKYDFQLATSATDVRQRLTVSVSGALPSTPTVVSFKPVVEGDAAQGIAQRVFFPAGVKVDPQATVSTLDEQLFGFVTKGKSKPLPSDMTISYSSNRPDVVRVGGDGVIQTVSKGVATITASVSYLGKSVQGAFAIGVTD